MVFEKRKYPVRSDWGEKVNKGTIMRAGGLRKDHKYERALQYPAGGRLENRGDWKNLLLSRLRTKRSSVAMREGGTQTSLNDASGGKMQKQTDKVRRGGWGQANTNIRKEKTDRFESKRRKNPPGTE